MKRYVSDGFWIGMLVLCVWIAIQGLQGNLRFRKWASTPETKIDWSCLPVGVSPSAIPEYYGCVEIAGQKVAAFRRSALVNGVYYSLSSTSFEGLNQMHLKILREAGQ